MRLIMGGELSPVMSAALLTGLRVKKETIGEITAAAQVMREFSTKVQVLDKTHLVDIVGTGGDGAHSFNISTCSMFVAAAAGAKISKHGNRSVSSKSGSADVLEALGVNLSLPPAAIARCIEEVGIGFMFAPNHHPAMKNVAPVRKELGVRYLARYRPLPPGQEVATGLRWAAGVTDIAHLTAGMAAFAQSPEAASLPRQREARDVAVRDYLRRWNELAGSLPVPPPTPAAIELVRHARLHQLSLEDAAVAGTWSDSWWTLAAQYAAVPEGTLSARTVALTDELRRRSPDPADYARALERELKTRRYTLEMEQAEKGENVLDSFLFEWRAGHCEYFATAMTMMLLDE
jgi:hypothetical protein